MGLAGRIQTWDFILVPMESFEMTSVWLLFFKEWSWLLWGQQNFRGEEWKLRYQLGCKLNSPRERH